MKDLDAPIKTIWLADDDHEDCEIFGEAMKHVMPFAAIQYFHDGSGLMEVLQPACLPDILFLDLVMPQKDGFECLKEIRQQRQLHHLPIVVYSDVTQQEFINAAYGYGANLFYSKPIDFAWFKRSLTHLFQLNWRNPSAITACHYIDNRFVTYSPID